MSKEIPCDVCGEDMSYWYDESSGKTWYMCDNGCSGSLKVVEKNPVTKESLERLQSFMKEEGI